MSQIREMIKKIREIDHIYYVFIIFGMYVALTKSHAEIIEISNDLSEWLLELKKGEKQE